MGMWVIVILILAVIASFGFVALSISNKIAMVKFTKRLMLQNVIFNQG